MNLQPVRIKKILYATDLSECSVNAYSYACSFAEIHHASIIMLHVVSETASDQFISKMINPHTLEEIKKHHYSQARENLMGEKRKCSEIKQVLQAFSDETMAASHMNGIGADEIVILDGPPAETIVKTSLEMHCDIIVMGTHGQGGFREFITGSTAKKVVSQSLIPVLVVRGAEED